MINEPTWFKNPLNPSSIDVILINQTFRFSNNCTLETGISDHHKMTITVLKTFFSKQAPVTITYRNYKNFDKKAFHNELSRNLGNISDSNYDTFEDSFMDQLNKHAPVKSKIIRANNAPFMNKILAKAVMIRSKLHNKYFKFPTDINNAAFKKQRNYCVKLFRTEKKKYYNNLDNTSITDNKKFWKTI